LKIRACKEVFYSNMTEEDLLSQILTDMESPSYPQVISNNECSASLGDENIDNDSPLSFLMKFKASFISPSQIPNGLSGIYLPEDGSFKNIKHNDNSSPFKSVNENHFNLTIKNKAEAQDLIKKIRSDTDVRVYCSFDQIKDYLVGNSSAAEWINFYAKDENKKWRKYFQKLMVKNFEQKHCELSFNEINAYKAQNPDDFEKDLKDLLEKGFLTDEKKKRAVKKAQLT